MARGGPAPKPDAERKRRNAPALPWTPAPGEGWQHGPIPSPPDGLMPSSIEAWNVWFRAWFAAFWTPADLPALRILVKLHDEVERGEFHRAPELRIQMDTYGLTPKGQQSLRWTRRKEDAPSSATTNGATSALQYGRLRAVSGS